MSFFNTPDITSVKTFNDNASRTPPNKGSEGSPQPFTHGCVASAPRGASRRPVPRGAALLALCFALSACDAKTNSAGLPLPLDAQGQAVQPKTPYEQWFTDKPSYFNLSDDLQLAIPPQYQKFWLQKNIVPRRLEDMKEKVHNGGPIAFHFFMPDFSGFTPENHADDFHPHRVEVLIQAEGLGMEQPGAVGSYPKNMYARMLSGETTINLASKEIHFGLECYRWSGGKKDGQVDSLSCYGVRNDLSQEMIFLTIMLPPYPDWVRYPILQADYFSPDHGGVYLIWRTHMKNFPQWKQIDKQIWRWINEWNIANRRRNHGGSSHPDAYEVQSVSQPATIQPSTREQSK